MATFAPISFKKGVVNIYSNPIEVGGSISVGLGKLELRKSAKAGLHLVRLSGSGNYVYHLRLEREGDYKMGPDYGFRIVSPEEEKDPYKKILRLLDIPVSKLVYMKEGEELYGSTFNCDIHRAYREGTKNNSFETDGVSEREVESWVDKTHINQYAGPEVHASETISIATYAIEVEERVHVNSSVGTYVKQVNVWPGCDADKLLLELVKVVEGREFVDLEYFWARNSLAKAKEWIEKNYQISSGERLDDIKVKSISSGQEKVLCLFGKNEDLKDLKNLLDKHGWTSFLEDGDQKDFLNLYWFSSSEEKKKSKYCDLVVTLLKQKFTIKKYFDGEKYFFGFFDKENQKKMHGGLDAICAGNGTLNSLFSTSQGDLFKEIKKTLIERVENLTPIARFFNEKSEKKNELFDLKTIQKNFFYLSDFRNLYYVSGVIDDGKSSSLPLSSHGGADLSGLVNGGKRNFILEISNNWGAGSNYAVVGLSITKSGDEFIFEPYDNGKRYKYVCCGVFEVIG